MFTFEVTKRVEVAGAHCLSLPYSSKCQKVHGHNWIIWVTVQSRSALGPDRALTDYGMVIDFTVIKGVVMQLDHTDIGEVIEANPTAENIAVWIAEQVDLAIQRAESNYRKPRRIRVKSVRVEESEGNTICFTQ